MPEEWKKAIIAGVENNRSLLAILNKARAWFCRSGILELGFDSEYVLQEMARETETVRQIGLKLGLGRFQVKAVLQESKGAGRPEVRNVEETQPDGLGLVRDVFDGKIL